MNQPSPPQERWLPHRAIDGFRNSRETERKDNNDGDDQPDMPVNRRSPWSS